MIGARSMRDRQRLTSRVIACAIALICAMPSAASAGSLPARIAHLVNSSAVGGSSVVYVWDQASRDVIYTHAAGRAVTPASNMKLLTSAAALAHWGEDHRFTTRIVTTGTQTDGTLNGSIYLIGGGDPVLATAGFARDNFHGYANATNIGGLASALYKLNITRINGSLIVVDDRFDAQRYVREWPASFRFDEAGALGALTVNESQLGKYIGGHSARYPDIQAGLQLRLALKRVGIAVTGRTIAGSAPSDATEIAHVDSPRLIDIVNHMNAVSDNFVAETLLKGIGADATGGVGGSTIIGRRAAAGILKKLGVDVSGVTWSDGSGLAGSNRVSARLIGHVLGVGAQTEWGPDWIAGLATSGGIGTLRHRMTRHPYRGNVHAKTGTLHNSSALAGFADSADGTHRYGFATVTYTPRGSINFTAAHNLQDHLAMMLVR